MIHTETSKAKICFAELPNDIIAYGVHHAMDGNKRSFRVASETDNFELCLLPSGNWTLLNTLDAVTEDEAKLLVEGFGVNGYLDYRNNMPFHEYLLKTAVESLHSLAISLGINEGKWVILYELKK